MIPGPGLPPQSAVLLALTIVLAGILPACSPGESGTPEFDLKRLDEAAFIQKGEALHRNMNCNTCHSSDGGKSTGTSYSNLFGTMAELENGQSIRRDADYLYTSIVKPSRHIVKGNVPTMPSYSHLDNENVWALVAYIKSLGSKNP